MSTTSDSTASLSQKRRRILCLVGDSDIARWPESLYPCIPGVTEEVVDKNNKPVNNSLVSGHSGATLGQILPYVTQVLVNDQGHRKESCDPMGVPMILVVCAGENDIGMGISLDKTVSHFKQLLDLVFLSQSAENHHHRHHDLIFLGPKFEPWMEDYNDPMVGSKQSYAKMDRAFQRAVADFAQQNDDKFMSTHVHYVDCLTMFCGDSAKVPGARMGGRAVARDEFFANDRLHLSDEGYRIWKEKVERIIREKCL